MGLSNEMVILEQFQNTWPPLCATNLLLLWSRSHMESNNVITSVAPAVP